MPTLTILAKAEQDDFVDEPIFTLQEKQYFFKVPESLLINLNSPKNKLLMTLLWGYFKATNKFYLDFKQKSNVDFVAQMYTYDNETIDFPASTLQLNQ